MLYFPQWDLDLVFKYHISNVSRFLFECDNFMKKYIYIYFLAEKYFDMKKNQCKEGLDIYKKFLTRMTRISEFLKVAEVNYL